MCGISGILHFNKLGDARNRVESMTDSLAHRGPDAVGYYVDANIAFGHRRLSIIDTSDSANQPFIDHTGRYVLVFNGEIYNYQALKREVSEYPYKTSSDTEVLMAAFCKWGIHCTQKLDGIFSFAVWDIQKEVIWLCRDRLGVKPLYYYYENGIFAFSSEQRSLMASNLFSAKIDQDSIYEYFLYQSIGPTYGMVKEIQQLNAGSYLEVSKFSIAQKEYWNLFDSANTQRPVPGDINKIIYEILNHAVNKRMNSDVPMGVFLSGGIDSSAIVALMSLNSRQPINTFNLYFSEKEYDESDYAEKIASRFGTNHTKYLLTPSDFLDKVTSALNSMDSPSADGINTYVLSAAIRNVGLKVAVSGIGGDELFAGYPGFKHFFNFYKYQKLFQLGYPLRLILANLAKLSNSNKANRIGSLLSLKAITIDEFYPIERQIFSQRLLQLFLKNDLKRKSFNEILKASKNSFQKFDSLSQYSIAEYLGYAKQTLLRDTDQMGMAVGLEIREPFFDYELIEYVLSLSNGTKYSSTPKKLLVESLYPLIPAEIVNRTKQGFVLPWEHWIRNELFEFCDGHIRSFSQRNFVNEKPILDLWKRFLSRDRSIRWIEIWQIVVLDYWLQKNLD